MKAVLLSLTFIIGIILALHLAMNAAVGKIVENPRMGNALFWLIGAAGAVMISLTGWDISFFSEIKKVPKWLFFAGLMGACLVVMIAYLIPKIGAGTLNVVLLAGQVIGGLIIAHYGLLSSPVEKINLARVTGVIIMIAGAGIAVMGRIPFLK